METWEKTGLLIEAGALQRACDAVGFKPDYKRIIGHVRSLGGTTLLKPVFVTMAEPRTIESSMRKLLDWMEYNGYEVDETAYRYGEGGRRHGTTDVRLVHRLHLLAQNVGTLYIVTDHPDIGSVIAELKTRGTRVIGVSTMEGKVAPDSLRRATDEFVDIVEWAQHIALPAR